MATPLQFPAACLQEGKGLELHSLIDATLAMLLAAPIGTAGTAAPVQGSGMFTIAATPQHPRHSVHNVVGSTSVGHAPQHAQHAQHQAHAPPPVVRPLEQDFAGALYLAEHAQQDAQHAQLAQHSVQHTPWQTPAAGQYSGVVSSVVGGGLSRARPPQGSVHTPASVSGPPPQSTMPPQTHGSFTLPPPEFPQLSGGSAQLTGAPTPSFSVAARTSQPGTGRCKGSFKVFSFSFNPHLKL